MNQSGFPQSEAETNQSTTTTILIDADATPRDAVATADDLAREFHANVITVSNIHHEFDRPGHITVDARPQAVDMEIVSRIHRGKPFIVITQDYGLAALAIGKGAYAVSSGGLIFTDNNIDRLLFERDLHAKERRATGRIRGGPSRRTTEDISNFAAALRNVLSSIAL